MTLHSLDAADIVVSMFGKLCIAQSTIDELQNVISEREGMWSKRGGMIVGKKGNRYVKQIINPEEIKQGIEYLKDIIRWIRNNCEVGQSHCWVRDEPITQEGTQRHATTAFP